MTSFYIYSKLSNHLVSLWLLQQLKIKSVKVLLSRILWSWENLQLHLETEMIQEVLHKNKFHIFK